MNNYYNNIFGWFDFNDIYNNMVDKYNNCNFLEIGCFQGKSACYMAENIKHKQKNILLYCVDAWPEQTELDSLANNGIGQGAERGIIEKLDTSLYNKFIGHMEAAGVRDYIVPIRSLSHLAVDGLKEKNLTFKFIFVDASHHYAGVMSDLELYWPLLENGGVMAGHDWYDPAVNSAVRDFFKKLDINVQDISGSWLVNKE